MQIRVVRGSLTCPRTPTACVPGRALPSLPSPADLRSARENIRIPPPLYIVHCTLYIALGRTRSPPKKRTRKRVYRTLAHGITAPT